MRGWLATVPALKANVTRQDDHGDSGGEAAANAQDRENLGMDPISYLNPAQLHSNPAFTQAVRIPAGHDLIVTGGQNGVHSSGRVVSGDLAGQARQALVNLQACLRQASADLDHLVQWSILRTELLCTKVLLPFVEIWGQRPNPPALSVAMVSGFAVTGALCEIDAFAAATSS
jgi:enamine deaminase RidA (YjgF/YER057c/UK114 family)